RSFALRPRQLFPHRRSRARSLPLSGLQYLKQRLANAASSSVSLLLVVAPCLVGPVVATGGSTVPELSDNKRPDCFQRRVVSTVPIWRLSVLGPGLRNHSAATSQVATSV